MALAGKPEKTIAWLKELPGPTDETAAAGHNCPPADRDALLMRLLLLLCAVENLRDANKLLRGFTDTIVEHDIQELATSARLLRTSCLGACCCAFAKKAMPGRDLSVAAEIVQARTGQALQTRSRHAMSYHTTKIGKIYFNNQPPPSMLNMMENMMGMMGSGGGMPGGMNTAMQAVLAQMQDM
jgi:hypothetical protein